MKLAVCIVFLFVGFSLKAQQLQNLEDLNFLYQAIKKTASYKYQFKNDKEYKLLYERLQQNLNDTNDLAVYKKLYQLISPINDNHLGFYKKVDTTLAAKPLIVEIDTDSLVKILEERPLNDLQGIYESQQQRFGVFKTALNEYTILHLKNRIVVGFLVETPHQSIDFIALANGNRGITLVRNVKHINGNLSAINLYKTSKASFSNLNVGKSNYEFRKLENNVDYLRLSSFYSNNANIAVAKSFFERVKDSINAPALIVDVRNNTGGGFKVSQQFINFIKRYKGSVCILQNLRTGSNAEKFLVRLKGRHNVITLGETTAGVLAYGSNYGNTVVLPNRKFYFYPTDTFDKADLPFENVGVKPDVFLNPFKEDWISQTLQYIKNKK